VDVGGVKVTTALSRKAFRRQPGDPDIIEAIAHSTVRYYLQLFLWLAITGAILIGLMKLSTAVADIGIPGWVPWVCGVVAYLMILRYGRKRGWY
jgi:hypothetical protein